MTLRAQKVHGAAHKVLFMLGKIRLIFASRFFQLQKVNFSSIVDSFCVYLCDCELFLSFLRTITIYPNKFRFLDFLCVYDSRIRLGLFIILMIVHIFFFLLTVVPSD